MRRIPIPDAALYEIGELIAYALAIDLFFLGAEVFTDFYSQSAESVYAYFQWFPVHGSAKIAAYTWVTLAWRGLCVQPERDRGARECWNVGRGGLLFTLMMKAATAISAGELSAVSMGPERSP
jgi:hypothetical protein